MFIQGVIYLIFVEGQHCSLKVTDYLVPWYSIWSVTQCRLPSWYTANCIFPGICFTRRKGLVKRGERPLTGRKWPGTISWAWVLLGAGLELTARLWCCPVRKEHTPGAPASDQAALWPRWSEMQRQDRSVILSTGKQRVSVETTKYQASS